MPRHSNSRPKAQISQLDPQRPDRASLPPEAIHFTAGASVQSAWPNSSRRRAVERYPARMDRGRSGYRFWVGVPPTRVLGFLRLGGAWVGPDGNGTKPLGRGDLAKPQALPPAVCAVSGPTQRSRPAETGLAGKCDNLAPVANAPPFCQVPQRRPERFYWSAPAARILQAPQTNTAKNGDFGDLRRLTTWGRRFVPGRAVLAGLAGAPWRLWQRHPLLMVARPPDPKAMGP